MLGKPHQDACGGDSGSPVTKKIPVPGHKDLKRAVQFGLVSFGMAEVCGKPGRPSGGPNVVYYMPWILSNLKP